MLYSVTWGDLSETVEAVDKSEAWARFVDSVRPRDSRPEKHPHHFKARIEELDVKQVEPAKPAKPAGRKPAAVKPKKSESAV